MSTNTATPRRLRWRSLVLLALLLAPLLWPVHFLAERYYREVLIEQNRQTLDLYVANLLGTLRRYEVLPQILGDLPGLRAALHAPEDPVALDNANRLLARVKSQTGADVIYLMNPRGVTLAASNWDKPDSFVAGNFAFRPYFREALAGRLGRFFGLGTTSGKRGYYFAYPVREDDHNIGALVVKVDLDHTETLWGNTPEQLLVTDTNGVVILTSRPDWRFHASRPLDRVEQSAIAANQPYPTQAPPLLDIDPNAWLTQSRALEETGWTVSILAPRILLDRPVRSAVAVGAAALLALLLLLGLLILRRRHYLERIALDARAKAELEQRVAERTQDLELLNSRLKQEVLEREQAQQELVRAQDELVQAGKLSALGHHERQHQPRTQPAAGGDPQLCGERQHPARSPAQRRRSRQPQADQRADRAHGLDHHPFARLCPPRPPRAGAGCPAASAGRCPGAIGQAPPGHGRGTDSRPAGRHPLGPGWRDAAASGAGQSARQCARCADR